MSTADILAVATLAGLGLGLLVGAYSAQRAERAALVNGPEQ